MVSVCSFEQESVHRSSCPCCRSASGSRHGPAFWKKGTEKLFRLSNVLKLFNFGLGLCFSDMTHASQLESGMASAASSCQSRSLTDFPQQASARIPA